MEGTEITRRRIERERERERERGREGGKEKRFVALYRDCISSDRPPKEGESEETDGMNAGGRVVLVGRETILATGGCLRVIVTFIGSRYDDASDR